MLEGAVMPKEPTDEQLADACMWSRHDFGLLGDEAKRRAMFAMRENWRAIWKACNTPGRGAQYMPSNGSLNVSFFEMKGTEMEIKLELLNKKSKPLESAIDMMKKQLEIHTPQAFYLTRKDYFSAVNAAAKDAKQIENPTVTFNGIPVKVL